MSADELWELDRIARLKYRYLRLLDLKRWDEIGACFTPDATATYSDGRHSLGSRDEIVAFFRRVLDHPMLLTNHRVHHPELELTGPDTASGVWALDDEVIVVEQGSTLRGTAYYHDRYVRLDGEWLIAHTGYERVYELVDRTGTAQVTANRFAADQPG